MVPQPLLDPLLVDQATDSVPGQSSKHGAQQTRQNNWQQLQLPLLHIKPTQGHDQLRGNRGEQILEKHR